MKFYVFADIVYKRLVQNSLLNGKIKAMQKNMHNWYTIAFTGSMAICSIHKFLFLMMTIMLLLVSVFLWASNMKPHHIWLKRQRE